MPLKNLLKMPFFKSSKASAGKPSGGKGLPVGSAENIELIRRRARHRLLGAAVLVLAGVVGFPLLFDTKPRPVSVDVAINIPDKATVAPLALPSAPQAPAARSPEPPAPLPEQKSEQKPLPAGVNASSAAIKTEVPKKEAPKKEVSAEPASPPPAIAEVPPHAKPPAPDDGRKALALLEGKNLPAAGSAGSAAPAATPAGDQAAAEGRFVVQVGAFADASKAREVRLRVEKAGLKTYTQVAQTPGGKRIRVRVGPFASRAQAEQAAVKIKALDLPAAILTL